MRHQIDPIRLAYKLDALRHDDDVAAEELRLSPRRLEAMWFLQEMSRRPGGLPGLVNRMVAALPDAFVDETMKQIGEPRGGRYTLGQCLEVWKSIRSWRAARGHFYGESLQHPGTDTKSLFAWLEWHIDDKITEAEVAKDGDYDKAGILEGVKAYNWDFLKRACAETAREKLPDCLRLSCEESQDPFFCIGGDWFCPDFDEMLARFMDYHAKQAAAATFADTAVVRLIDDEIDNAEMTRLPIVLNGESGVGKSTIARALAEMWPGRRRYFVSGAQRGMALPALRWARVRRSECWRDD